MNYLREVIEFNEWAELNGITISTFRLWHALMDYNNRFGWSEWFTVPIVKLQLKTGMERSTIYNSRNQLVQLGRIKVQAREGRQSSMYHLIAVSGHNLAHNLDTTLHTKATQAVPRGGPLTKDKLKTQTKLKQDTVDVTATEKITKLTVKRFMPPTLEEIADYCKERNNSVNPKRWLAHYEANGWRVGKNPMKSWKASVRTWEHNNFDNQSQAKTNTADKIYESDANGWG